MKHLLFILLLTLIGSSFSHIAWSLDVRYNGELRFRLFYSDNLSDGHDHNGSTCAGPDRILGTSDDTCDDQETFTDARFRLRMSATEGVTTGVLTVDFLSQEGDHGATLASSDTIQTGNWRLGSEGIGGGLDTIYVREAYLHATIPWVRAVVGRQPIQFGHGLVLDDTLDAIVLGFPAGPVNFTVGGFKLIESDRVDGTMEKADSDGLFSHFVWVPASGTETSLYFVYLRDQGPGLVFNGPCGTTGGVPPAYQVCDVSDLGDDHLLLYVLGWALNSKVGRFHLGLELDALKGEILSNNATLLNPLGEDIQLQGYNGLIDIGFRFPQVQVNLTGLYASGQDYDDLPSLGTGGDLLNINAISPNYVLGNILVNNETTSDRDGGDIGGLTAVKLALERTLWFGTEGELAVIWARLTEKPVPGVDQDLGWELDFNTTFPIDDHLLLISTTGILFPGEGWQALFSDPGAEDIQIKLGTILSYTF